MLKWIIGLLVSSPLLFGAALYGASEYGGETVQLETFDERGNSFLTTLWVVDLHEEPWIRAGDPEAGWLQRLQTNPQVLLTRDGQRKPYRAELSDEGAGRINEAMREKYGRADRLVSLIHEPEAVVAVRLVEPSSFDPF
jgi:hypothetical protein